MQGLNDLEDLIQQDERLQRLLAMPIGHNTDLEFLRQYYIVRPDFLINNEQGRGIYELRVLGDFHYLQRRYQLNHLDAEQEPAPVAESPTVWQRIKANPGVVAVAVGAVVVGVMALLYYYNRRARTGGTEPQPEAPQSGGKREAVATRAEAPALQSAVVTPLPPAPVDPAVTAPQSAVVTPLPSAPVAPAVTAPQSAVVTPLPPAPVAPAVTAPQSPVVTPLPPAPVAPAVTAPQSPVVTPLPPAPVAPAVSSGGPVPKPSANLM